MNQHEEMKAERDRLTGCVTSAVLVRGGKRTPLRRMYVTPELAARTMGDVTVFKGRMYQHHPRKDGAQPALFMYVRDDDMEAAPVFAALRWPAYVPPPSRAGTPSRFREIALWQYEEEN